MECKDFTVTGRADAQVWMRVNERVSGLKTGGMYARDNRMQSFFSFIYANNEVDECTRTSLICKMKPFLST